MVSANVKLRCKNNLQKIFGGMKKINSSLHCKTKNNNSNMLSAQKHIETKNWFSPIGYDTSCGASMLRK